MEYWSDISKPTSAKSMDHLCIPNAVLELLVPNDNSTAVI